MDTIALSDQLSRRVGELPFSLPPQAEQKLLDFIALLEKWNHAYNLTAVRQPAQMISRHLMDSLVVMPYLSGQQILDVGSGAGLPGIPLALACPERQFTLLDSNGKKVRFMRQAVAQLGLENVSVVHSRVEQFQSSAGFDTIIARAYATLGELVRGARHLCRPDGRFLIMKGAYPVAELDDLSTDFELETSHSLRVPGLEAERHLLVVRHVAGRQ
ncbi:MAG: 16S rRNA (guanine(527)-N(7))-methyltransferase RsmG [Pseudomonadota bacterium]|nr:16S rRNA (guanine(527)-N(7))-methyltransferase RsmG [Pseudomonadota bacterium]